MSIVEKIVAGLLILLVVGALIIAFYTFVEYVQNINNTINLLFSELGVL